MSPRVLAFATLACALALPGCRREAPKRDLAGAVAYPNFQVALQSGRQIYVDAESVNLAGGAGADWTPTKATQTTGLWNGTGGAANVKVDMAGGSTGVTFANVASGTLLQIAATKVYNTTDGTSASNIIAQY